MKSLLGKVPVYLEVIGYIVFFFCMEGWGMDWKGYGTSDTLSLYYDVESITRPSKDVVRVWVKGIYRMKGVELVEKFGEKYETLGHSLFLSEVHCAEKKVRTLSIVDYSTGGEILDSNSTERKWNSIVPESIGESLYEILCRQPQDKGEP